MKKVLYTAGAIIGLFVVVSACDKNVDVKSDIDPQMDKMALMESFANTPLKASGPLNYMGDLCPGDDFTATTPKQSFGNPENWNYYRFQGVAGEVANINVVRVDCGMDPSFSLYFGTSAVLDGISATGSSNPDLTFVAFRDDQVARPASCDGTCFAWGDPGPDVVLPSTGWYTLAVYDFASCEAADLLAFNLNISGIHCNIIIDGCDSGVMSQVMGDATMQELIDLCSINPKKSWALC